MKFEIIKPENPVLRMSDMITGEICVSDDPDLNDWLILRHARGWTNLRTGNWMGLTDHPANIDAPYNHTITRLPKGTKIVLTVE